MPPPSRAAWASLVVGVGGLALATALWIGSNHTPAPPTPAVLPASAEVSRSAQARLSLAQGRAMGQSAEPIEHRLRGSLPFFLRALELDPSLAPAAAEAAFVHVNLRINRVSPDPEGDLREAERLAALAMRAEPEAPLSLSAQATVLWQQRRFGEALGFFQRAGAHPMRVVDRANAGIMLLLLGDTEGAAVRLRAAIGESPGYRFADSWRFHLGLARLMAGRPEQAADDFAAHQLSSVPAEERLLYRLVALREAGRSSEAQELEADLRQRDPALLSRPLVAFGFSEEPAYRARFGAAVLAPLQRMGWADIAR